MRKNHQRKKLTNLEFFCRELGWQGGTIHQVSRELMRVGISRASADTSSLIYMNEAARQLIMHLYMIKRYMR